MPQPFTGTTSQFLLPATATCEDGKVVRLTPNARTHECNVWVDESGNTALTNVPEPEQSSQREFRPTEISACLIEAADWHLKLAANTTTTKRKRWATRIATELLAMVDEMQKELMS